MFKYKPLVL